MQVVMVVKKKKNDTRVCGGNVDELGRPQRYHTTKPEGKKINRNAPSVLNTKKYPVFKKGLI